MSGATVRAVFSGTPYPVSLMEAVLLRIRAERNITWERAAILKAYLAKIRMRKRSQCFRRF
ncbi:MAG: type I-C CRISPR-associated protein Cas8c/Csd1 [Oscillospiraceae bacterium]